MPKGISSTQRTLRAMREEGRICAIVEKWNSWGKREDGKGAPGIRVDLFGIIDVLALDPERGVVGVQCCSGGTFPAHYRKLTEDKAQNTHDWLSTPGTALEIWAWRKILKVRGGKAKIWVPRIQEITLEDIK